MNLLSELSSELAVAMLLDKKHSETVEKQEAVELIDRVYDILEPISTIEHHHSGVDSEKAASVGH